jgi:hypothetical protein
MEVEIERNDDLGSGHDKVGKSMGDILTHLPADSCTLHGFSGDVHLAYIRCRGVGTSVVLVSLSSPSVPLPPIILYLPLSLLASLSLRPQLPPPLLYSLTAALCWQGAPPAYCF